MISVWSITFAGMFMKLFWLNAPRKLYTGIYVLMGWLVLIMIWPLSKKMETDGLMWMGIGGAFYTIGAVIYALKKPDPLPKIFGFHEIFHVFVLLGSFSHYLVVYSYS